MTEFKDTDLRVAQVIFFLWLAGVCSFPAFLILDMEMKWLFGGTKNNVKNYLIFCMTSMAVPIAFNWIKFGKFMLFPKGSTERNSKHESSTKEINVFSDDKKASLEMDETDPSEALAKFKRLKK